MVINKQANFPRKFPCFPQFRLRKSAVLGGIVVTFVATLLIVLILVLFALYSGFVDVTDEGVQEFKIIKGSAVSPYVDSFNNLILLRALLSDREVIDKLNSWNAFGFSTDKKEVADKIDGARDKRSFIEVSNEETGTTEIFSCNKEGCFLNFIYEFPYEEILEFQHSPFKIKLKVQKV